MRYQASNDPLGQFLVEPMKQSVTATQKMALFSGSG
jgi:hypothetical protein